MGSADKFFVRLTAPLFFKHSRSSLLRGIASGSRLPYALFYIRSQFTSSSSSSSPSHIPGFRIKSSPRLLHIRSAPSDDRDGDPNGLPPARRPPLHWPEWSRFIGGLTSSGYFDRKRFAVADEDAFALGETPTEEFVRAAHSCLAFAHDRPDILRLLSRKDVEVIIDYGTPFLFKNAADSTRRMVSYSDRGEDRVLKCEAARTVDLMRFLLSHVNNPTALLESSAASKKALFDSSARVLLAEMTQGIRVVPEPAHSASSTEESADPYQQQISRRPDRRKIGDWICKGCNLLNPATNRRCLKCESLPKSRLVDGEWRCSLCDFYNNGSCMVCLKCQRERSSCESFSSS